MTYIEPCFIIISGQYDIYWTLLHHYFRAIWHIEPCLIIISGQYDMYWTLLHHYFRAIWHIEPCLIIISGQYDIIIWTLLHHYFRTIWHIWTLPHHYFRTIWHIWTLLHHYFRAIWHIWTLLHHYFRVIWHILNLASSLFQGNMTYIVTGLESAPAYFDVNTLRGNITIRNQALLRRDVGTTYRVSYQNWKKIFFLKYNTFIFNFNKVIQTQIKTSEFK